MKIDLQAQKPLEWLALSSGFVPQPVLLAHFGFIISKVVGETLRTGILEAIAQKHQTPSAIAHHCELNETAVSLLLQALVGLQLVKIRSGKYFLKPASKRWLLQNAKQSYAAQLLFDSEVCYAWLQNLPDYLKTGKGLAYHQTLQSDEWALYQQGMQSTSGMISKLAAQKITIATTPSAKLLDIGGAHGLYSMALLDKYPLLTAEVLDLPEAVAVNAGKHNPYSSRLQFVAGDVLQTVLPKNTYDAVILANVAHHFTAAENLQVAQKVLSSLKKGGRFYILEFFKKKTEEASTDMIGALQSFFFSFSSTSGLWMANEIKNWFIQAAYINVRQHNFAQLPGLGMVSGQKG